MFCQFCGENCPENTTFCPKCGQKLIDDNATYQAPAAEATYQQPVVENNLQQPVCENGYQAPAYEAPAAEDSYQAPTYQQSVYPNAGSNASTEGKGLGIAAMVLGIVSFLCYCCCGLFGIPLSVAAVVMGIISNSKNKNGFATAGLILGIISIVIFAAYFVLSLVLGLGSGLLSVFMEEAFGSAPSNYGGYYY